MPLSLFVTLSGNFNDSSFVFISTLFALFFSFFDCFWRCYRQIIKIHTIFLTHFLLPRRAQMRGAGKKTRIKTNKLEQHHDSLWLIYILTFDREKNYYLISTEFNVMHSKRNKNDTWHNRMTIRVFAHTNYCFFILPTSNCWYFKKKSFCLSRKHVIYVIVVDVLVTVGRFISKQKKIETFPYIELFFFIQYEALGCYFHILIIWKKKKNSKQFDWFFSSLFFYT